MPQDDLNPVKTVALDWFTRRQSGAMTAAENSAFKTWCAADPAHARAYARLADLWSSPEFTQALTNQAQERKAPAAAQPLPRRKTEPKTRSKGRPRPALRAALALAAMLVLTVGLGQITGLIPFGPPADHATATGERTAVTLPDGSRLTLNAESAVNVAFSAERRRIELLRGEAFFDVEPDPGRPFEVVAGRALTRVLGTAFSVALRGDETEIRVQRGHVRVSGDDGSDPVDLLPGQGVTVASGHAGDATAIEPGASFAWLDGRFVFRDQPLADVMARLSRHHRGKIVLATEHLRNLRVSGNYRLDAPDAVVSALAAVAEAEVIRLPGLLTILH